MLERSQLHVLPLPLCFHIQMHAKVNEVIKVTFKAPEIATTLSKISSERLTHHPLRESGVEQWCHIWE